MVTIRSSSSDVISPALFLVRFEPFRWGKAGACVPFVQVNIRLLADQVGISSAHPLDLRQGVHDLLLAIDVGVEKTEDELDCKRVSKVGGGGRQDNS
jgi:hypothetical protein